MKKISLLLAFIAIGIILCPSVSSAGDAFLKAGYSAYIDEDEKDKNSFIFTGGSDWKLHPFFSLGLDAQYSYKKYTPEGAMDDQSFHFFNLYANAKAYMGRDKVIPFVGAGFGLVSATTYFPDFDDTEFEKAFGAQFLGGLIIGTPSEGPAFVAEVQFKVPTGDLKDIKSVHILGGIIF
jgi:hypothetical protein